jgi:ADP-ribose pyrophosphatase YjhB (NUDIX family)
MHEIIKNRYTYSEGNTFDIEYTHTDSFDHLPIELVRQCIAVAYHGDKIILVNNINKPGVHVLVGGGVEPGEKLHETIAREIHEESNMRVIESRPLGYQKVTDINNPDEIFYQVRFFCIVEPYGPFVGDPDGDVTEVLEIDIDDHKKYFDWGETSDAIMARAKELKKEYENKI